MTLQHSCRCDFCKPVDDNNLVQATMHLLIQRLSNQLNVEWHNVEVIASNYALHSLLLFINHTHTL